MKQKFVNGTLCDRRKGSEAHIHSPQSKHPLREGSIATSSMPAGAIPAPKPKAAPAPLSDLDKMKAELASMMASEAKKTKAVPKSKLIRMASVAEEPDPTKQYGDILAMLLAKK